MNMASHNDIFQQGATRAFQLVKTTSGLDYRSLSDS